MFLKEQIWKKDYVLHYLLLCKYPCKYQLSLYVWITNSEIFHLRTLITDVPQWFFLVNFHLLFSIVYLCYKNLFFLCPFEMLPLFSFLKLIYYCLLLFYSCNSALAVAANCFFILWHPYCILPLLDWKVLLFTKRSQTSNPLNLIPADWIQCTYNLCDF